MKENNSMYADFIKAQKEFGPALKTSTNPHFRSKYADLSACIEAVIDGLNNNNFALIQKTHECDSGVAIETILLHESGDNISAGVLKIPASKQDPQGYGSAMTYARRYSLMSVCGIAPEDDDGQSVNPYVKPVNKPILQQKIDDIKQAQFKMKTIQDLTLEAQSVACKGWNALESWWKSNLSQSERDILQADLPKFKSQAKEFDHMNQDVEK